jgi:hypothetical protein
MESRLFFCVLFSEFFGDTHFVDTVSQVDFADGVADRMRNTETAEDTELTESRWMKAIWLWGFESRNAVQWPLLLTRDIDTDSLQVLRLSV